MLVSSSSFQVDGFADERLMSRNEYFLYGNVFLGVHL